MNLEGFQIRELPKERPFGMVLRPELVKVGQYLLQGLNNSQIGRRVNTDLSTVRKLRRHLRAAGVRMVCECGRPADHSAPCFVRRRGLSWKRPAPPAPRFSCVHGHALTHDNTCTNGGRTRCLTCKRNSYARKS